MKKIAFLLILFMGFTTSFSIVAQDKKERLVAEESDSPEIILIDNILHVKNAPVGSRLEVITIVGNKVRDIEIKFRNGSFELNLPKGIYIFRLEGLVRKFVVK